MGQAKFDVPNLDAFLKQVDSANKDHISFAKFVMEAEVFCKNENDHEADENLLRYRKIWFELEVINALALDDWESTGKPENWQPQWEEKYKNDAQEIITELRTLLDTL